MYTIRKEFKFEAAHVLTSAYSSECKTIHGHSYRVEVFLNSEELEEDGMVLDFKKLKEVVKPLIDKLDHALMVESNWMASETQWCKKIVVLGFNPTAENLAEYIFYEVRKASLPRIWFLSKVRVWETDTGWAEYYE